MLMRMSSRPKVSATVLHERRRRRQAARDRPGTPPPRRFAARTASGRLLGFAARAGVAERHVDAALPRARAATTTPMRLPPVIRATLSVRSTRAGGGVWSDGRDRLDGREGRESLSSCLSTRPSCLTCPRNVSTQNVPKNAERLFGSLHLVPSAEPVNTCCAATPIVGLVDRRERVEPLHRAAGRVVRHVLADVERNLAGRHLNLAAVIGELNRRRRSPGRSCRRGRSTARSPSRRAPSAAPGWRAGRRTPPSAPSASRRPSPRCRDCDRPTAPRRPTGRRATTPLKLPRSTFQASTACLPTVSASLFMMQPPVKTSAVRASTYAPLTVPLPPARSGEAARPSKRRQDHCSFHKEPRIRIIRSCRSG